MFFYSYPLFERAAQVGVKIFLFFIAFGIFKAVFQFEVRYQVCTNKKYTSGIINPTILTKMIACFLSCVHALNLFEGLGVSSTQ